MLKVIQVMQEIFSGKFLTRDVIKAQYKLLGLIAGLIFLYIWCGFGAQRQYHRLTQLNKELEDARFIQMTLHGELVKQTRQSAVAAQLRAVGSELRESTNAVVKIP